MWVDVVVVGTHNDHGLNYASRGGNSIAIQTHLYVEMLISYYTMNTILNPEYRLRLEAGPYNGHSPNYPSSQQRRRCYCKTSLWLVHSIGS